MAPPHRLQRPEERNGVGPIDVFRALAPQGVQPLSQVPQKWTRSRPAFQSLEPDARPEIAAAVRRAEVPDVDKVWTELAYESVRTEVAPQLPSRLDALFCFADVFEAFSFTEVTDAGRPVFKGTVDDGVPWAVVDMARFAIVNPTSHEVDGYEQAWQTASLQARGYWAPGAIIDDLECAEVLVAGSVSIESAPLRLIPTMRSLGLIV